MEIQKEKESEKDERERERYRGRKREDVPCARRVDANASGHENGNGLARSSRTDRENRGVSHVVILDALLSWWNAAPRRRAFANNRARGCESRGSRREDDVHNDTVLFTLFSSCEKYAEATWLDIVCPPRGLTERTYNQIRIRGQSRCTRAC